MRFSIDTGGTFTDLIVEDHAQRQLFKAPTTPDDPVRGMLDVLGRAAAARGVSTRTLLEGGELLLHATTHALNAVLSSDTARTALVVTEGHEAVLVLREGGRGDPFDFTYEYPEPYIPQALTFGTPERIGASGEVVIALTESAAADLARRLKDAEVEAVAVCLLWSIVNPVHERLLGSVLARELPGVPVTLSHQLNPSIREYRRASSAAINASLRPLMGAYLASMQARLREAGFDGRVLVVSSTGALLDPDAVAVAPLHTLNSGPSMGPVAGAYECRRVDTDATAIVLDSGGTSFDVSVVQRGRIPRTRETWVGSRFRGFLTGFPSVDVRSVGAGGGSIARVDDGGLLHVGPDSAGSVPGPVAYGRGGDRATVTDAALVLGYLDADGFLDGTMPLEPQAARDVIAAQIGAPLGLGIHEAAAAVIDLATEIMIQAVEGVTTYQGIDPADCVLVGGGGAAGLNLAAMAARLGCRRVLLPDAAAGLSAEGALVSELARDFAAVHWTTTAAFDRHGVNATLDHLREQCELFVDGPGRSSAQSRIELFAEARYPRQVWEIEVPLRVASFDGDHDIAELVADFHAEHEARFAFSEPSSVVEVIGWRARAVCELPQIERPAHPSINRGVIPEADREAWFASLGATTVPVYRLRELPAGASVTGPAIVETGLTTVVLGVGQLVRRSGSGGLDLVTEGGS
jgi:N-methylhydantoinase A